MEIQLKNDQLKLGKDDAPIKVEVFSNLSCPGSKIFYGMTKEILPEHIESGKIQYILKLYDKPREELLNGFLIHLCLEYDNPKRTFEIIDDLFTTQEEWIHYNSAQLKQLLVSKYGLHEEEIEANTERSLQVTLEAIERDVKLVPTLFINGEKYSFKERRVYTEYPDYIAAAIEKLNL